MNTTPTIKLVLDPRDKRPERLLKIRITYGRIPQTYTADCKIRLTETEFGNQNLKKTKEALSKANKALRLAESVVEKLGTKFTFPAFKKQYREALLQKGTGDSLLFVGFAEAYISKLSSLSTKESYHTAVRWLDQYRPHTKITAIDRQFIVGLTHYIQDTTHNKGRDISVNTLRIYLRSLKAIYNKAVDTFGLTDTKPFAETKTNSSRRQNYSLSPNQLTQLVQYSPQNEQQEFGKDFFILSFALCGANLGDILMLRNKNVEGKQLRFQRRKTKATGIEIILPLGVHAIRLLKKYGKLKPSKPNEYILPFLLGHNTETAIRNRIRGILKRVNKGLDQISKELGMKKITTYTARHTYGSIARNKGLTAEQIQKFFGHTSSKTTEIYLDNLSQELIETNQEIIDTALK